MNLPLTRWRKIQGDGSTRASRLDLDDWNGLLDELGPLLAGLIRKGADFDAVAETAIGVLLDRINGVLAPAYDDVVARIALVNALIAQLDGAGITAAAIIQSAERRFVSDALIADLQSRLTVAAADLAYARLDGANCAPLTSTFGAGRYTVAARAEAALSTGRPFRVRFPAANPAGPVDLVVKPGDGAPLPAKRLRRFLKGVEIDILPGDITAGVFDLVYDETANAGAGGFIVLHPQASPAFGADKGGIDQTGIATGTQTKVTFANEAYDIGGIWDAATSRVQPAYPCRLRLGMKIYATVGNVAGAAAHCLVFKNGQPIEGDLGRVVNTNAQTFRCDSVVEFNGTTDYAEFFYSQTGTGDKTISGSALNTSCYGFLTR